MGNTQPSLLRQVLEGQPQPSDEPDTGDEAVFPWEKTRDAELGSAVVRAPAQPPVPRSAPGHAGHMKLLFENAPVAMAMFDCQMRYLLANRRWLEDFKLNNVDVTGRSQYELFPSLHPGWRHVYERALNGQVVRSDRDAITQDGRPVVYRWEVRPWRHVDTTIGGVMISCERLYALPSGGSAALAKSGAPALHEPLWGSAVPLLAVDASGRIVRVSRGAMELLPAQGIHEGTAMFWQAFGDQAQQELLRRHVLAALNKVLTDGQSQAVIFTSSGAVRDGGAVPPPAQWLVSKLEGGISGIPGESALLVGFPSISPFTPVGEEVKQPEVVADQTSAELRRLSEDVARLRFTQKEASESEAVSRQREARLRAVLELAPCGLMVLDEHARPIYHNAQIVALLGRSLGDGQSVEAWLTEGTRDEQHHAEIMRQWTEGVWRKQLTLPLALTSADGLLKEIEMRPVSLPGGGLLVMMHDVTESRRGEEMLRSAEAKYRVLVHENPLPVLLTDRSGAVFDANPAAESLLGYNRAELRRITLDRWLKPEALAKRATSLRELQQRGERSGEVTVEVIHRDGFSFPAKLRLALVPDAAGQPMFTAHFFSPVEAPVAPSANPAQQPPAAARKVQTQAVVLLTTDVNGRINSWSEEAQERFGFDEQEALGRGLHMIFRPSDATGFYAELLTHRNGSEQGGKCVEWPFFHKIDGRQSGPFLLQFPAEGGLSAALLEEITIFAPVAPDPQTTPGVVEEVPLVAETPSPFVEVPQAAPPSLPPPPPLKLTPEDMKRERLLLGETHHRVKNHLQIITSMLNLQMSTLHNDEARDALRSSQNRVRSVAALHQHLYQLATGEASDFRAFATQLIGHLRECYQVDEGRVRLQLHLPEKPVPEEWLMPLALALNEMVSNAFKHAFPEPHQGNMRVELAWDATGGELTVVDDGAGLPSGFSHHDSTGLGLKILRVFAGQLGGEVKIHSAPGQGAVFQLWFPIGAAQAG